MEVSEIVWWSLMALNWIAWIAISILNKKTIKLKEQRHLMEVEIHERRLHLHRLLGLKTLHSIVQQVGEQAYNAGLSEATNEEAQSAVDSILNTFGIPKEGDLDEENDL